jgi:hypothetical protein
VILEPVDLLVLDPVTGARTGLDATVRRALGALKASGAPYCVVGATALAVRGLPRMTRDLGVVVMIDDAPRAIEALRSAGLRPEAPLGHLLLLYLYSNQPKHLGDFAAIVTSGRADLGAAERTLAGIHPEMLEEWKRRVQQAEHPLPAPPRPAPRRRTKR